MLDIKFIRENAEKVQSSARDRGYDVNISELLGLDDQRRQLIRRIDELREKRNQIAGKMKGSQPSPDLIEQGKAVKAQITELEAQFNDIDVKFTTLLHGVPNIFAPDTPIGDEAASTTVREWGDKKSGATNHLDLAVQRDWVDFERGAKVAGNKFYYLKGDLARLEMALLQYGLEVVTGHGFTFMDVPYMVKDRIMGGAGFTPRTSEQSDQYVIEGENLELIATSEIPLTGYHADEIIDEAELPLLYAGYSPAFRKEAGAAGKFEHGLYRVHQFNKLEMYAFATPEQSPELHEKILAIEEEIMQSLGVPYRVINIASGDLGAPAYKKYDIEWWSPVDETYREITSCSNCTDYQARNLNIRVRRASGEIETLHTLNGTAVSLTRLLMVALECWQDGEQLRIPDVLQKFMNNQKEI
jgi:seryl-tRNA synthetase